MRHALCSQVTCHIFFREKLTLSHGNLISPIFAVCTVIRMMPDEHLLSGCATIYCCLWVVHACDCLSVCGGSFQEHSTNEAFDNGTALLCSIFTLGLYPPYYTSVQPLHDLSASELCWYITEGQIMFFSQLPKRLSICWNFILNFFLCNFISVFTLLQYNFTFISKSHKFDRSAVWNYSSQEGMAELSFYYSILLCDRKIWWAGKHEQYKPSNYLHHGPNLLSWWTSCKSVPFL